MNFFQYKARDRTGHEVSGQIHANTKKEAQLSLLEQNLYPVFINELKPTTFMNRKSKFDLKELIVFTRQFQLMFSVGLSMERTLTLLSEQTQHQNVQVALQQIRDDIVSGTRLSEAFSKFPSFFPPVFISMLELGQSGGILDKTLREMIDILEREQRIRSRLKTALLYPKIVFFTLLLVTWLMLVFVFPPYKSLYDSHNATLPTPTRIVMGISDLLTTHWYLPVIILPIIYFLWRALKKQPFIQRKLSILELTIPVFGKLKILSSNARFSNMTSALYRVGLPLPQILSVISTIMENQIQRGEVLSLKQQIENGSSLHEAMKPLKYFSPLIKETCTIGEQTGKLDQTLSETGNFYTAEVEEMLTNLSTLIEPFMLFGLFGIVLLLALAVYLPIWNISTVVLQ